MQQKLFSQDESHSNSKTRFIPKDHAYETDFPGLDFILIPYAFLLGIKASHTVPLLDQNKLLCDLFCTTNKKRSNELVHIETFIEREAHWFKRNPTIMSRKGNLLSVQELRSIFVSGAVEIERRHRSIQKLKRRFRKKLPPSDPPLVFGKVARYINNGAPHEFWYEETGAEIAELFPEFDPDLIKALLAITSIRTSLPSNVTKTFKSLDQFHREDAFIGFLDVQLHYLNLLKQGESLTNPADLLKNGRKIKMFARAMGDDVSAIVDDVWITRAFGADRKREHKKRIISQSPTRAIYDATEWYLQTLGGLVGKQPRGVCAMIWAGIRQEVNQETARYTDPIKSRLNHGLFAGQYGNLRPGKNGGIEFETK